MGEMRWTPEQKAAIEARDCSLLVAAAAGSGKTAVLVERIIRMITDEDETIDIDDLLIVTFTNAAATEMRERIAEAISKVLEENPSSPKMGRQLTLLNKASITTIHSFCLEVIRNNFQNIDIDPGFRIADETEALLLKLEVLQDLFEDMYEDTQSKQEFLDLLECYGGNRDDQALQNMVLNLFNFIQSDPWPERWLQEMTSSFNLPVMQDLGETSWGEVLLRASELELQGLKKMMEKAIEIIGDAQGLDMYFPVFQDEKTRIDELLSLCKPKKPGRWDALYNELRNFCFAKLPRAGKECDQQQRDYVKDIRDNVKKRIGDLTQKVLTADSEENWRDLQTLYPLMKCLSDLVREFTSRYSSKKSEKSIVDFNDLEHFCLEILSVQDEQGKMKPSKAAVGYRERYAEILVDEYQDSNDVQETIIQMISKAHAGKPNVFMVGDVKQSIYRFRQANPGLFQKKYKEYAQIVNGDNDYSQHEDELYSQLDKKLFCKILLYKNFRSRKEVVDAVNFIFKQIMSRDVGELEYTDEEALKLGADFPVAEDQAIITGGEVELHLLQTGVRETTLGEEPESSEKSENELKITDLGMDSQDNQKADNIFREDAEMLDSIQGEARLAARRIKELLQPDKEGKTFHVLDKESKVYRKAEYKDLVVLLRTTRNWADIFMDEFTIQGIPAFADTGSGFFKTVEVQVILSLLQIIDNPLQDIPLLAVLRSPVVSFTSDELAELRLAHKKVLLFEALRTLAKNGTSPAAQKAGVFLKSLEKWRDMSLYMSTDQLLWQLYEETGYFVAVGARPAGQQRQANLRILFERARQFEETSFKGLFNFIYFVDKLKSGKGDMGSAKMLGEKDNVVRIMSIHKSKGLEFPVVILAGCGKKFNLQDMNKNILVHHKLGFGPDVVDYRRRIAYPSIPKLAIREKIRMETMSEEMRILYVALTRAKERLIITGTVKDIPKALNKWSKWADVDGDKLPPYQMIKAGNYLDWIGPAVSRHKAFCALPELSELGVVTKGTLIDDPSVWSIRTWSKLELLSSDSKDEQDENEFIKWLEDLNCLDSTDDGDLAAEIGRRIEWEYPYSKLTKMPAKVTVTELKRRFEDVAEGMDSLPGYVPGLIKKPLFLEGKRGLSAAEAGTVLHFVMQHLDFEREDIEEQIALMVTKDLLTQEQAKSVDPKKIRYFLASILGRRMLASARVNREVPFNIEIPCQEIYSELDGKDYQGETVLLQGVIDCYFEEPDGIVLVDYKTDYVRDGEIDRIRGRYEHQISYYARALEALTGKKVKEKYIYLFAVGEAITFG